jgi:outer membrane protein assembly factor BamA
MRTFFFVFALIAAPVGSAAQEPLPPDGTRIALADIAGLARDRLTPELRAAITALGGTPLRRDRLQELVGRIERENPDLLAAIRSETLPDGGTHVSFVVARISDDPELLTNINARYVVESVSVAGPVREEFFSQSVRDQMQAFVGKRLDPQETERLTQLIAAQFAGFTGSNVKRRFERGSQPGQIRLVFDIALSPEWNDGLALIGPIGTRWQPKLVYHGDQGWSTLLNFGIRSNHNHVAFGAAISNNDDDIEQYSGFRIRFNRDRVGTDRVGFSIGMSRFMQSWRDTTLMAADADSSIPGPYEARDTFESRVIVRPFRGATISAGAVLTALDPIGAGESMIYATPLIRVSAARPRVIGDGRHYIGGAYEVRFGSAQDDSGVDYTRHEGSAGYEYTQGRSRLQATWLFGRSSGHVPLFERFALGDTNTLRGWNKFELAPAGGTRMFHQSLEYRYRIAGIAVPVSIGAFVDVGSVWNDTGHADTKYSIGGGLQELGWFATVAVPLKAEPRRVVVMAGLRF